MKRFLVLGVLFLVGTLSMSAAALQAPAGGGQPAPRVVTAEKLRDNLYMMGGQGGGGNSAVFITAAGVVVVDTKNPGWGQPLLEKIKSVTDKPVTMIINTHTHGDHVSGNVEFPATVEVVTQENTAKNMEAMRPATGITPAPDAPKNIFKENGGRGMPKRTFKDNLTIGKGDERIELHYFGRGHTNGDAFVVFPALRVMHAGDIFSGKNVPLLDANNGGSNRNRQDPGQGRRRRQGCRSDHHRSQHRDDGGRPARVRRVQQRVRRGRSGGKEGRQDSGRSGKHLEDPREVQRLRRTSGRATASQRPGRLGRNQVGRVLHSGPAMTSGRTTCADH